MEVSRSLVAVPFEVMFQEHNYNNIEAIKMSRIELIWNT